MTATELAAKVGTTQATISRLENGERQLKAEMLVRIANALQVNAADLLEAASIADTTDDVEPHTPNISAAVSRALAAKRLAFYRVVTDALLQTGLEPGAIVLVDTSMTDFARCSTGDILVAKLKAKTGSEPSRVVLRQFLAPSVLTTNRPGTITAFNLINDTFDVEIVGAVVSDDGTSH